MHTSESFPAKRAGVVFDLDGTLLDTLADIGNAANSVLERHGFPLHPIPAYRLLVGEGVRRLFERALPEDARDDGTIAACLETMRAEYQRNLNVTARVYPEIPELLAALGKRRLRLAVFSNKPDPFTQQCVQHFFPPTMFDIVLGQREGTPRKPDPTGALEIAAQWQLDPASILYLGDTGTDMQTATGARMIPVGALWGFRDEEELRNNGAAAVITRPLELLPFL